MPASGAGGAGPRGSSARWAAGFYACLGAYFLYLVWRVWRLPLYEWDESRCVLHAFEMMRGGDWIAYTYGGALDPSYAKPPLAEWLMAALFRLAGYSEAAARLPSILLGLGTGALVYHVLRRVGARPQAAAGAGLGLVTCLGFYGVHAMTSGDTDICLTFFNTLSFAAVTLIAFEGRAGGYRLLGLSLGLGFMTKSAVGLMPLAALPVAAALNRTSFRLQLRPALDGAALAGLVVLPWLAARSLLYPDHYLARLIGFDLLSRAAHPVDGHVGGRLFYVRSLAEALGPWLYAGCAAAACLLTGRPDRGPADPADGAAKRRRVAALAGAMFAVYFVGFSAVSTKICWYILPALPLFLMLTGLGLDKAASLASPRLVAALTACLLLLNLDSIRGFEARRWTGVVPVDFILFPFKTLLRGRPIVLHGEVRQNTFVTARVYSGLRETVVLRRDIPLDELLASAPGAEYLLSTEAQRYDGDPRLRRIVLIGREGREGSYGLFRIVRP